VGDYTFFRRNTKRVLLGKLQRIGLADILGLE
jgi:hypothetical protein